MRYAICFLYCSSLVSQVATSLPLKGTWTTVYVVPQGCAPAKTGEAFSWSPAPGQYFTIPWSSVPCVLVTDQPDGSVVMSWQGALSNYVIPQVDQARFVSWYGRAKASWPAPPAKGHK